MPGVMPVTSGGIHVWHILLVEIFGDDSCLQFGGGTLGHPGVMLLVQQLACLGSCVQARNEGRNLMREGGVIHEACKWSPGGCCLRTLEEISSSSRQWIPSKQLTISN